MAEIGRRLVHASGVIFPGIYLLELTTWTQLGWLLVLGSLIAVGLEVLRLGARVEWWIYDRLIREYEADSVAGYAYYMWSITLVAWAFEPSVAIPGMLMLMLGDPVSGVVHQDGESGVKQWPSLLAMFVVCLVVAIPFATQLLPSIWWGIGAASLAAIPATAADAYLLRIGDRIIDDNLTIPIAGALGLWIGVTLFASLL